MKGAIPGRGVEIEKRTIGRHLLQPRVGGIVVEDVDALMLPHHICYQRRDAVLLREVERHPLRLPARRLNRPGDGFCPFSRNIRQDHRRASLCQGPCAGLPDIGPRSGDDSDPSR